MSVPVTTATLPARLGISRSGSHVARGGIISVIRTPKASFTSPNRVVNAPRTIANRDPSKTGGRAAASPCLRKGRVMPGVTPGVRSAQAIRPADNTPQPNWYSGSKYNDCFWRCLPRRSRIWASHRPFRALRLRRPVITCPRSKPLCSDRTQIFLLLLALQCEPEIGLCSKRTGF